jgi:hypothetical protein
MMTLLMFLQLMKFRKLNVFAIFVLGKVQEFGQTKNNVLLPFKICDVLRFSFALNEK